MFKRDFQFLKVTSPLLFSLNSKIQAWSMLNQIMNLDEKILTQNSGITGGKNAGEKKITQKMT